MVTASALPLYAKGSCTNELSKLTLKDFKDGKSVELNSLLSVIDKCLGELAEKERLKSKLSEEWGPQIKKRKGGTYSQYIKNLVSVLEEIHNEEDWKVYGTFNDTFFTKSLGWCEGWDDGNPTPICENGIGEIGEQNAHLYRYHLLYAFVRDVVAEKGHKEDSPAPQMGATAIDSLQDKLILLEKEMKTYKQYSIPMFLGLSVIMLLLLFLILNNRNKIRKLRKAKSRSYDLAKEPQQIQQRHQAELSLTKADVKALINSELSKRPSTDQTTTLATTSVTSIPSSGEKAYTRQKSESQSNPVQPTYPKKIIAYASIPNKDGIFPTTFPSVTNKAYYQIFTDGKGTNKTYFSLVDDIQRRKSAFNAPDTIMPPSTCEKRYSGAVDYTHAIKITPGEAQKTSSGKWKVTKQMLVET